MGIDFKSSKGIFLQIAENICHQILAGQLPPGQRVPSVRDLAVDYEVNRNTVLRTYEYLYDRGIIENKRGIGSFVAPDAIRRIRHTEREAFFRDDLPDFINKVKLLDLNSDDLSELITLLNENQANANK